MVCNASWFAPFNEKPDSYPLMDLQAALDAARTCKAPPGKAKANEYLKRCRADMKMVGERVNVEIEMPEFHLQRLATLTEPTIYCKVFFSMP